MSEGVAYQLEPMCRPNPCSTGPRDTTQLLRKKEYIESKVMRLDYVVKTKLTFAAEGSAREKGGTAGTTSRETNASRVGRIGSNRTRNTS